MGNQISAAAHRKSGLPFAREPTAPSSRPATPSQQDNSEPTTTRKKQRPKLKLTVRGRNPSRPPTSPPSTPTSGSTTLRQRSTGTDGASTPKEEKFESKISAPSTMTEVQYLPWSLHPASPSEASTITPDILEVANPPPSSSATVEEASLLSASRPSSPASSDQQPPSRPLSSDSFTWGRSRPLSAFSFEEPVKVPAPPLRQVHFNCYQDHRRMLSSQNVKCPVPCMTCGNDDELVRWKCVWCCLRICGPCRDALSKCERRDLGTLVKKLDAKAKQEEASKGEDIDLPRTVTVPARGEDST